MSNKPVNYSCKNAQTPFVLFLRVCTNLLSMHALRLSVCAIFYAFYNYALNQANALIFDQYKHFIGPVHFKSMARLLGYQGIAVVLDELLNVVKTLIQGNILELTKILMRTLKPNCKLGAYSMTSIGILGKTIS